MCLMNKDGPIPFGRSGLFWVSPQAAQSVGSTVFALLDQSRVEPGFKTSKLNLYQTFTGNSCPVPECHQDQDV